MTKLSFPLNENSLNRLQVFETKLLTSYNILQPLQEKELNVLKKYAYISNIGGSTRIENAQLTDVEIQWIDTILTASGKQTAFAENKRMIENKLSKDRERSIEEVGGCREMLLAILQESQHLQPLRETDIRYLHDVLLRYYSKADSYKGQYKAQPNSVVQENHVTGEKKIIFKTADAGPITAIAMQDLVDWYNATCTSDLRTVAITAEFVFRFLAIHPFQDGNGRLGRGLFLLGLLQSQNKILSYVSQFLAIDRTIEKHKEEYYFTLNRCSGGQFDQNNENYHIEYFFDFMLKILDESLDGIALYRHKYQALQKLSSTALNILNCFQENPEIRLTAGKIHKTTDLPMRTINYAINNLLEGQLIQKYGQGSATTYQLTF